MKRKSSKYLEFYKECMKTMKMPDAGLCRCFSKEELIIKPTKREKDILFDEGFWSGHWGHGKRNLKESFRWFTPLRQTIVLFMHEMTVNPIEE